MPRFSRESLEKLGTCHKELRDLCHEAILLFDFSVLCGYRGKEEQNSLFEEDLTKVKWPNSYHNRFPSDAVDLAPWPIDWNNRERFFFLAGIMTGLARERKIKLTWGGAWLGTLNKKGGFDDLGHFERREDGKGTE